MYENYDGNRKYETLFTPHPEVMLNDNNFIYVTVSEKEPETIKVVAAPEEEKQEEKEPEREEKGLTVTNNVSYEVKDEKKKGLFNRRENYV